MDVCAAAGVLDEGAVRVRAQPDVEDGVEGRVGRARAVVEEGRVGAAVARADVVGAGGACAEAGGVGVAQGVEGAYGGELGFWWFWGRGFGGCGE